MKTNCQAAYDTCCSTQSCRNDAVTDDELETSLGAADDCAKGSDCSTDFTLVTQATPEGTALQQCIVGKCKAVCKAVDPLTTGTGNDFLPPCAYACAAGSAGNSCTCVVSPTLSGPECDLEHIAAPGKTAAVGRCCVTQAGTSFSCTCDLTSTQCDVGTVQVAACTSPFPDAYASRTETCSQ